MRKRVLRIFKKSKKSKGKKESKKDKMKSKATSGNVSSNNLHEQGKKEEKKEKEVLNKQKSNNTTSKTDSKASKTSKYTISQNGALASTKTVNRQNSAKEKLISTFETKLEPPSPSVAREKNWLEETVGFEDSSKPVILNDFKIIKALGNGSYGNVIMVQSIKTEKRYAMKILEKKKIQRLRMVKQVIFEIKIMTKITHENIIKYETHFEDNKHIFLILELADSGQLYSKLKRQGLFKEEEASVIVFELLKAVNYLHTRFPAIIHRDIKPENILFKNDVVKLADFGSSNFKKEGQMRRTYCGTRDYLAPEMIFKKGHDEKVDVWTIGVMLFEICTGKAPFTPSVSGSKKKTKDELLAQLEANITQKELDFPIYLSEECKDLISKLACKDPESRVSCVSALKHPWFRKFGLRFNEEKENLKNDLMGYKKREMDKKKQMRNSEVRKNKTVVLNFAELAVMPTTSQKSGKHSRFLSPKRVFKNLTDREIQKEKKELKKRFSKKANKKFSKKNITLDRVNEMTVQELSEYDQGEAFKLLLKRYRRLKTENKELEAAAQLKNANIRDLEDELQELKKKMPIKETGDFYSKIEIQILEGQKRMNQLALQRIKELDDAIEESGKQKRILKEKVKALEGRLEHKIRRSMIGEKKVINHFSSPLIGLDKNMKSRSPESGSLPNFGPVMQKLMAGSENKTPGNNYHLQGSPEVGHLVKENQRLISSLESIQKGFSELKEAVESKEKREELLSLSTQNIAFENPEDQVAAPDQEQKEYEEDEHLLTEKLNQLEDLLKKATSQAEKTAPKIGQFLVSEETRGGQQPGLTNQFQGGGMVDHARSLEIIEEKMTILKELEDEIKRRKDKEREVEFLRGQLTKRDNQVKTLRDKEAQLREEVEEKDKEIEYLMSSLDQTNSFIEIMQKSVSATTDNYD